MKKKSSYRMFIVGKPKKANVFLQKLAEARINELASVAEKKINNLPY